MTTASDTSRRRAEYTADVIECARDICTYIYETHGRFPAHVRRDPRAGRVDAGAPLGRATTRQYFRDGLTDAHRAHDALWHAAG